MVTERERERDTTTTTTDYSRQNYYNRDYNSRHVAIGPRRGAFVSPCACVCVCEWERERERERCNVKSDVRSYSCFVFTGAKGGPRELTPQLTCKNTKLRALIYRHKNFWWPNQPPKFYHPSASVPFMVRKPNNSRGKKKWINSNFYYYILYTKIEAYAKSEFKLTF